MVNLKTFMALAAIAMVAVVLTSCEREVTRIESDGQPVTCGQCHDTSDLITGKATQWAESRHATGTSYVRGTSSSCAGCHSGSAFVEQIMAGLDPDELEQGDPEPTRQDCRACHMIHTTYTMEDFELRTEEPVALYAMEGVIFDGGEGNLCANCHQPRRVFPEVVDGMVSGISSHWGPHHGPQSAMILGVAGAGDVEDMVSGHYGAVENTCVHCHLGEGEDHHFEAEVESCEGCHPGISSFDYEDVQTDVQELIDELGERLEDAGLINENSEDGHPIVTEAPEDQAIALWNWIYVAHEDKSLGVHNPDYAKALLEEGLARLPGLGPALP